VTDDRRDDEEAAAWLLARERGAPGPSVPAATAERYQRLQALIEELPELPRGAAPGDDWQKAVFAALDAPAGASAAGASAAGASAVGPPAADPSAAGGVSTPAGESKAPRLAVMPGGAELVRTRRIVSIVRWVALAAIVPLLALVALFAFRPPPPPSDPVAFATLDVEVLAGRDAHRSPDPSVGDQLVVRGMVHGTGELRVYDADGAMRAQCTQAAADCVVARTGSRSNLQLTLPLRAPGALRVVLFAAPLDGPSGGLDADVAAAGRAGISVTTREPIQVR
jgi:hypothetical protein